MITTQAKLLEKTLSPNGQVAHLLFQTEAKISFLEGQFMMIECLLHDSRIVKKPYSIATAYSIMESANLMGFYVKQEAEGGCSEYLVHDIEIGEEVSLKGPAGHFVDKGVSKNYLFISTGSGLAPNLSLLRKLGNTGDYNKIAFLFGERYDGSVVDGVNEMMKFGLQGDPAKEFFKLCYSHPHHELEQYETQGYIQTQIPAALKFLATKEDLIVFLCGKPQMVEQSIAILIAMGVGKEKMVVEKY